MSYLLDSWKYQPSSELYRLERADNNIKRSVYMLKMKSLNNHKSEILKNLKNSEVELKDLKARIKGINWYAFMFGFAIYYSQHICRNRVLLNEMNLKALPHLGICTAVGLAFGVIIGYSTASNYSLYRKFISVSGDLKKIEGEIQSLNN